MEVLQLDLGYKPDTTIEPPVINHIVKELYMEYTLSYFDNDELGSGAKGRLTVFNCPAYEFGAPTEDTFMSQSIQTRSYADIGFEMDEFYQVSGVQTEFYTKYANRIDPSYKYFILFTKTGSLHAFGTGYSFDLIKRGV